MTWFSMIKLWFSQQPGVNNYAGILRKNALQKDFPPTPKTESAMSEENIEVQTPEVSLDEIKEEEASISEQEDTDSTNS